MSGARPAQRPMVAVCARRAARVRRGGTALALVAALGTTAACTPAAGAGRGATSPSELGATDGVAAERAGAATPPGRAGTVDAATTPTVRGKEAPPSSPAAAGPPESAAPSTERPLARSDAGPSSLDAGGRGPDAHPASPCPEDMAFVAGQVCVDRWEASLVVVLPDGEEKAWSPYQSPPPERVPVGPKGARLRAVSRAGVVPQGYLSGAQAAESCAAAGKRLCQPQEWERACRGPDDTAFPYGEERQRGVCNDGGRSAHPVKQAFASLRLPDDRMWYEGMQNPLINQLDHTVARTGEHAGCTNAYGTFDMVGNLHEWVDDPAGTFRGGFYMDTKINGDGCEYATTAHPFDYHDYSTGFRCCLDPRDGD